MRQGDTPEDKHATNDYLAIQDCIYKIVNQYETKGRYEFFIMLAGEMMHNAIKAGALLEMNEGEILSEFAEELSDQAANQRAIMRAQHWIKQWENMKV